MVYTMTLFTYLVAAAAAVTVLPLPKVAAKISYPEPSAPAHYSYEYSVNDKHYGDVKSHKETRDGDHIKGSYSLLQPDGTQRIVEYTVDKKSGFQAKVRYEGKVVSSPTIKYPEPAPVAEVIYSTSQAPDAKEESSNFSNVSFRSQRFSYKH
ncbi:cuticle protein 7-like [Plodia interpunctella]|uniref:cuticle protein 7-like n=1 Tax=Plodia interpunctella TaxID=58824 RepID=UPI00236840B9|nr:cuticle protein 7-like [Plodia interpunctella]